MDGRAEFEFEVEIAPSKLDYEDDYDQLTAEIQAMLQALILRFLGSTFEEAEIGGEGATDLEWTIVLGYIIDDLERALHYISRHPRRTLVRQSEAVRADQIRRSDSSVRRAVARGKGTGAFHELSDGLKVRRSLAEARTHPTLDTPEHRWLMASVNAARRRLAAIQVKTRVSHRSRRAHGLSARASHVLAELEVLEDRLTRLLRLEPLRAAAGVPPFGFSSLQLQGAPGYREAFQACTKLARGLNLSGGPVELSLKDLHLLYEYWCYLAVLELVADVLSEPIPIRQLLAIEQTGLRVRLERGRQQTVPFGVRGSHQILVTYSPQFSGDDYLLPQKPDISIALVRDGWPLTRLVLDAKYRLDSSKQFVDQMGAPGPPFDAINVLHRYRDAILERDRGAGESANGRRTVVEGVALFPLGFPESERFDETRMWSSLERLGIGALPFLPGEKDYVRRWLTRALSRSGWQTADRTIPSASRERLHEWRQAASEAVMVGVLRQNEEEHLRWIRRAGRYYTPYTPSQPLQLTARWIALYRRAAGEAKGSVCIVAPIETVDTVPRSEIRTPWSSSRNVEQVVLTLGPLVEMRHKVENARGERFSRNRWTSKLALDRARRLEELTLETEPEWRLYDALKGRGLEVALRPGRPQDRSLDNPRGRTWIAVGDAQAQYRGKAGWCVRRGRKEWIVGTIAQITDILLEYGRSDGGDVARWSI